MKVLHNFIDGEYVPAISGESSEIINPSTGQIYTSAHTLKPRAAAFIALSISA